MTIYVPLETDPWLGISFPGTVFDAIVAGEPYTIAWSISDPQGILTSASLWYSLDDGRTFTSAARLSEPSATDRAVRVAEPRAPQ